MIRKLDRSHAAHLASNFPTEPRADRPKATPADSVDVPSTKATATAKFAELKASIPQDLVGHGSDGEPFFLLGTLPASGSEDLALKELGRKVYPKKSESLSHHGFLPTRDRDEALRHFATRADALAGDVPEESKKAFADAASKTIQLFFNSTLFAQVRAVDTSTFGPQYGREALSLLGRAHTGQWFYVALELVA